MEKLNKFEAYKIMFEFWDRIYFEEGENDDLGALLGAMSFYENTEGSIMDQAIWNDWEKIVKNKELDLNNTYNIMLDFMEATGKLWAAEYIVQMVEELRLTNNWYKDREKLKYWEKAYEKVKKDSTVGMIKFINEEN